MTSLTLFWALSLIVTAIAAWTDVRTGRIPNWLTGFAFAGGVAGHTIEGAIREGFAGAASAALWSLAGAVACAAPLVFFFARGAMGGGDLKLFAALGALLLPTKGLEVEVYGLIIGVIVCVGDMVQRGVLFATIARVVAVGLAALRSKRDRARIEGDDARASASPDPLMTWFRLGPSILVGAVCAWLMGEG